MRLRGTRTVNVWISQDDHLFQLAGSQVVSKVSWASLGRPTPAILLHSDRQGRGLWLGFRDGTGVAYLKEGQIVASYDVTKGLGRGMIGILHPEPDGSVWVATEGGLSRIKDGKVSHPDVKERTAL